MRKIESECKFDLSNNKTFVDKGISLPLDFSEANSLCL